MRADRPRLGRTKRAGKLVVAVLLFVALVVVLGTLVPRPLTGEMEFGEAHSDAATRRVLLLYNPIHTDIAFPAEADVLDRLGFLRQAGLPVDHTEVKWIVFGWGGRSFYLETPTWADLKPGPVFRALSVDRSVMHVALAGEIEPHSANVDELLLTERQFDQMLVRALSGFTTSADGNPKLIAGAGYGEFDRFYEGAGYFNALLGCNTWAANVLREGGLQTGWWNPLPVGLRWSLKLHN